MSGSTGLDNLYVVDGVNITNTGYGAVGSYSIIFGSLGTGTPFDFVQEVQVKTGGYEAEFGQSMGGVVNVVTKSGTNDLRGSVFGYFQPAELEAALEDLRVAERHGEHRRQRAAATPASRAASRSSGTSCSSSAPSTRRGRSARSRRRKASPCAAWARLTGIAW